MNNRGTMILIYILVYIYMINSIECIYIYSIYIGIYPINIGGDNFQYLKQLEIFKPI